MSHICLTYHIVWRTKNSRNTISESYERNLYAYIVGMAKEKQCYIYRINSMPDHLHMCVEIHPTIAVSQFVRIIKQETSKWIKEHPEWFPLFDGWGNGYAVFTYSFKERNRVIEYIRNQKKPSSHSLFQRRIRTAS